MKIITEQGWIWVNYVLAGKHRTRVQKNKELGMLLWRKDTKIIKKKKKEEEEKKW